MYTIVHWSWLIALLRRTAPFDCALGNHSVTKLIFIAPSGQRIEVPADSQLEIWMED